MKDKLLHTARKAAWIVIVLFVVSLLLKKTPKVPPALSEWFKADVVYDQYDLDGNEKKDEIILTRIRTGDNVRGFVTVNGGEAYEIPARDNHTRMVTCRIVTLHNNRQYLITYSEGADPGVSKTSILTYRSDGFHTIYDFENALGRLGDVQGFPVSMSVDENTLTIEYAKNLWMTGPLVMHFEFTFKEDELKRDPVSGPVRERKLTAARTIQTYKKANNSEKGILIEPGQTVTAIRYWIREHNLWICVRNSEERSGWIKCTLLPGVCGRSASFLDGFYLMPVIPKPSGSVIE